MKLRSFFVYFMLAACVVLIVTLAVLGGTEWEGPGLRGWTAIAAVGSIAAATATTLAIGAVGIAASELDRSALEQRMVHGPYLRVDVSLGEGLDSKFQKPTSARVFDARDFGIEDSLDRLAPITAPPDDAGAMPLMIWVRNQQTAPLGTAFNVFVRLLVAWDHGTTGTFVDLGISYVEPGTTTAYQVVLVKSDIEDLFMKVWEFDYYGLLGKDGLPETHGALTMRYDRTGEVRLTHERTSRHSF